MKGLSAEEVFRAACGFSRATDLLVQYGDTECATAEVVIEALCLELYLKCLLIIETGKKPRGHAIKELFDRVAPQNKAKLEQYYDEDLGNLKPVTFQQRGRVFTSDLQAVLRETSDAFVKWRYKFEPGIDPPPILGWHSLRVALLRLILELQPSLVKWTK